MLLDICIKRDFQFETRIHEYNYKIDISKNIKTIKILIFNDFDRGEGVLINSGA